MIYIYNDDAVKYTDENKEDLKEYLNEQGIEINDTNLIYQASNEIQSNYEDIKNMVALFDSHKNYDKILVVASLGLWYGRRTGSKKIDTLQAGLFSLFEDVNAIYFKNKNSALTLRATHHDGENFFRFYKVVNGKKYAIKYADIIF